MMAARRALLRDDERDTAQSFARALESQGFACVQPSSLDEAMAMAGAGELSLAVVDVSPGKGQADGLALIAALRASPGRPPVIVTSTAVDGRTAKAAMHAGASYFLEKPVTPDALVKVGNDLLSERNDFVTHVDNAFTTAGLTEREAMIGKLVLKGLNNREIAGVAGVTEKSVRSQITGIYEKCGVTSRSELFFFVFPS